MAEKTVNNLSKTLEQYRELAARRAELDGLLSKADAEKKSVKQTIYERVADEYRGELDEVTKELNPLQTEIDKTQKEMSKQLRDSESKAKEVQEKLEEFEFRYRVGEFTDSEYSKMETPLKKQLEDFFKKSSEARGILEQIDAATNGFGAGGGSTADTQPVSTPTASAGKRSDPVREAAEGPKPPKASGKPMEQPEVAKAPADKSEKPSDTSSEMSPRTTEKASKPSPMPSQKPAPKATTADEKPKQSEKTDEKSTRSKTADEKLMSSKAADKQTEPTPQTQPATSDIDDVIDLTDWTKEFQRENTIEPKKPTESKPKKVSAKVEDPDPLSKLADPSVESMETSPPASRKSEADVSVKTAESPAGFPVLIIIKGPGSGKKLPLVPVTMTIGREHDNNIELKDEEVARYHARISFERGQYVLEDLESSSGTWVNDEKITEAPLKHGDKIKFGTIEMMIDFD
jgi:hypothetical protein